MISLQELVTSCMSKHTITRTFIIIWFFYLCICYAKDSR